MTLATDYQNFIHLSRYARWDDEAKRRETWDETVDRYFDFFVPYLNEHRELGSNAKIDAELTQDLRAAVLNLEVMPSMRCLMTAGRALARDHVAGYNCAYRAVDDLRAFDEILFILMCGTGVGFSVERQYINKLPAVADSLDESQTVVTVRDSKRGWAEALRELISLLYAGRIPKWDTSRIRPAGSRLKTMGGRASGPEPLVALFEYTVRLFRHAAGRKLTSVECHDLVCRIGDCVVVGGVRRSAMLSLSNLSDVRMRDAKSGEWYNLYPHRRLANNSVAYTETPEVGQFMAEWLALYNSKSGERGIFNREAARQQAMSSGRRRGYWDAARAKPIAFGTNPCSEIILRSREFCNLTEVVVRPHDDMVDLADKVRLATILGTWQACLTDFRYITKKWRDNCDEERLLGVSLTGIYDNPDMCRPVLGDLTEQLRYLREIAVVTNREWAERLGIPRSAAITCVKPSGTVSQLVDSGAGIHPRYSHRYIRRVRQSRRDPLTMFMVAAGFPHEPDVMAPNDTLVFDFPLTVPAGATVGEDVSAIEHLKLWKTYQDHWCEHKPSITITVKEPEWPAVGAWVWDNFDAMSGVSFLPHADHVYRQAPYEAVSAEKLAELESRMPRDVDWAGLADYEDDDHTTAAKEYACSAGACDI